MASSANTEYANRLSTECPACMVMYPEISYLYSIVFQNSIDIYMDGTVVQHYIIYMCTALLYRLVKVLYCTCSYTLAYFHNDRYKPIIIIMYDFVMSIHLFQTQASSYICYYKILLLLIVIIN